MSAIMTCAGLSTMARAENEDEQKEPENFAVDTTFNIPLRL